MLWGCLTADRFCVSVLAVCSLERNVYAYQGCLDIPDAYIHTYMLLARIIFPIQIPYIYIGIDKTRYTRLVVKNTTGTGTVLKIGYQNRKRQRESLIFLVTTELVQSSVRHGQTGLCDNSIVYIYKITSLSRLSSCSCSTKSSRRPGPRCSSVGTCHYRFPVRRPYKDRALLGQFQANKLKTRGLWRLLRRTVFPSTCYDLWVYNTTGSQEEFM